MAGVSGAGGGEAGDQRDDRADALPADLDVTGYVGPYTFPDLVRRRVAGLVYLTAGAALIGLFAIRGEAVLVNSGLAVMGMAMVAVALYHLAAGWRLMVSDGEALVAATRDVGFPVGHASAQLGWRGLLSRPTWRILLYSAEDPPARRGLVLVDGVDGTVLGNYVEQNPEDWSNLTG